MWFIVKSLLAYSTPCHNITLYFRVVYKQSSSWSSASSVGPSSASIELFSAHAKNWTLASCKNVQYYSEKWIVTILSVIHSLHFVDLSCMLLDSSKVSPSYWGWLRCDHPQGAVYPCRASQQVDCLFNWTCALLHRSRRWSTTPSFYFNSMFIPCFLQLF